MASCEDFPLERRILCIFDYDLTLTEEFQQIPIFRAYFDKLKQAHEKRVILRKNEQGSLLRQDGKYVPETDEQGNPKTIQLKEPLDYFKAVDARWPHNNGVGYLEQMKRDIRDGNLPIKRSDLLRFGAEVQLAPGIPEFLYALKKQWNGKCHLETAIVSVGILDLIIGSAAGKAVDRVYASELFSIDDPEGLTETYSIITPFSKSETIIIVAKGGKVNQRKEMHLKDFTFKYYNTLCTGDGMSDVDHFAYIRKRGGTSICVYKKDDQEAYQKVENNKEIMDRVRYLLPRDYTVGGDYWEQVNQRIEYILGSKCEFNKQLVDVYKKRKVGDKKVDESVREHIQGCDECKFFMGPVRKVAPRK